MGTMIEMTKIMITMAQLSISWVIVGMALSLPLLIAIKISLDAIRHKRYLRAARFAHEWYSMELGPEFEYDGNEGEE